MKQTRFARGLPATPRAARGSARVRSSALALVLVACGSTDTTDVGVLDSQAAVSVDAANADRAPSTDSLGTARDTSPTSNAAGAPIVSTHITTLDNGDGTLSSKIDATSEESWVYFSLESKTEITPDDPAQSPAWDLGFERFNVKLNGGVSGAAGVSVAVASGPFDDVLEPPTDGFVVDNADADMDGNPDYAFAAGDGWYEYDPASHTLRARDTVYVVKTASGYFRLQFSSYYDAAGTPGMPQFRWARLGGS